MRRFWKYEALNDPKTDFSFLVRIDRNFPPLYSQAGEERFHYYWGHDAEGAIYAYFRLANAFAEDSAKRKKYVDLGLRMADLWLEMMRVDPLLHAVPTHGTPTKRKEAKPTQTRLTNIPDGLRFGDTDWISFFPMLRKK